MKKLLFPSEYFNPTDTLECGQIFRFVPSAKGEEENERTVFSRDKACKIRLFGDKTEVLCEENDEQYFLNYFDGAEDYSKIVCAAENSGFDVLSSAAKAGKGIRILRQDSEEMLYSFMISQNNNIPRIKNIIGKLCEALGEEKTFGDLTYRAFPSTEAFYNADESLFRSAGLGYRAPYIKALAAELKNGLLKEVESLSVEELKKRLMKIKGVGEKVADCVCLFGFHKTDSFPVDVWLEKVYREDFKGELTDRKKITAYFTELFGGYAGYFQQYLFYYKRTVLQNKF